MMTNNYAKFMKKVLEKAKDTAADDSLDFLLGFLEDHSIEDIINNDLGYIYKQINPRLGVLNKYNHYLEVDINEDDVIEAAKVMSIIKAWFIDGIEEKEFNKILAFSMISTYFGLPFVRLVDLSTLGEDRIQKIAEEINKLLIGFKIDVGTGDRTPYNENRYYEEFEKGIKSSNIFPVYDFIEAIERGMGFTRNRLVDQLIKLSIFLNRKKFIRVIADKQTVIEYVYFLNNLSTEELLSIGTVELVKDKWLLFEILRQLLGSERDLHLKDKIEDLTVILEKIAITDHDFFQQSIKYYNNFTDFAAALGALLGNLDISYIDYYLETISFDIYNNNVENNKVFMQYFEEQAAEEELLYLLRKIHQKWGEFLQDLIDKETYPLGIIYTDYFYSVYHYYYLQAEDSNYLNNEITRAFDDINKQNYYWKESSVVERIYFYIFLTKIYIYSLIIKEKDLSIDPEILSLICEYFNDQRLWLQWFDSLSMPEIIKIIFLNIRVY